MVERLVSNPPAELVAGGGGRGVLHSTGRRSALCRRTPGGVRARAGGCYLVCSDRGRDWARNLIANPRCRLRVGGGQRRHWAITITAGQAVDTIDAYLVAVQVRWAKAAVGLAAHPHREAAPTALPTTAVFGLEPDPAEDPALQIDGPAAR